MEKGEREGGEKPRDLHFVSERRKCRRRAKGRRKILHAAANRFEENEEKELSKSLAQSMVFSATEEPQTYFTHFAPLARAPIPNSLGSCPLETRRATCECKPDLEGNNGSGLLTLHMSDWKRIERRMTYFGAGRRNISRSPSDPLCSRLMNE